MPTTFPPGEYIRDELAARGWTADDLAARMGGDVAVNRLSLDLLIHAPTPGLLLGDDTARGLAAAFGTSALFWLSLDRAWQASQMAAGGGPAAGAGG